MAARSPPTRWPSSPTKKPGELWGDDLHGTYYAVFAPITYTVTFNTNGGIGVMDAISAQYGEIHEAPGQRRPDRAHGL